MQYIERKITLGWPQQAIEFIQLFARVEGALKQSGHLKRDKKNAPRPTGRVLQILSALNSFSTFEIRNRPTRLLASHREDV